MNKIIMDPEEQEDEIIDTLVIQNTSGIHVRPAGVIVKLLEGSDCEVTFTYQGETVNARSIMSLLMLGASQGGEIIVKLKGYNTGYVLKKLKLAFETGFGEI